MTENSRSHNELDQKQTRKRCRTTQACVPCRRSKVKCTGKMPCTRCKSRDIICMPGTDARSRAERKLRRAVVQGAARGKQAENSAQTKDQANLLDREIHCSITSSDASVSSAMYLHYGPSSTFVFLQQLYRFLLRSPGPRQMAINQKSENHTADVINAFGYSSIFFGREGGVPADLFRNLAQENQDGTPSGTFHAEQLPLDLAENFLELYLSTMHHLFSFCEDTTLRSLFYSFFAESYHHDPCSRDSTLILTILAVGATVTENSLWAGSLFRQAKANLDSWGDAVSLRSVQISMLLAEFHQIYGRPHSSMLMAGTAAHKALAIGLHHDIPRPYFKNDQRDADADRRRVKERNATFWCVYAQDRNLSLFHGRPACINDADVYILDPTDNCYLTALVTLSRISNKVYYSVYGQKNRSIAEFCENVQELREDLLRFHESLDPKNRFPLTEVEIRDPSLNVTMSQMLLAFSASFQPSAFPSD
jgi:hypothetical protein